MVDHRHGVNPLGRPLTNRVQGRRSMQHRTLGGTAIEDRDVPFDDERQAGR
jgi:hypothetical protein